MKAKINIYLILRCKNMNENEIRMLICKSQEDGFRNLFQEYQRYVYTIVWDKIKSLGTAEDAEECVSDIFAEVFIHFEDINEGSLKAYIGTIAKRTAIHRYRTLSAKSGYIADSDEFPDIPDEVDIQKEFEEKEYYKKLYQCILSLGEPDSSIIIQKYFYNRKSADIAESVGLLPITVRVRAARALKRLRKILSDNPIKRGDNL